MLIGPGIAQLTLGPDLMVPEKVSDAVVYKPGLGCASATVTTKLYVAAAWGIPPIVFVGASLPIKVSELAVNPAGRADALLGDGHE